jgi:hypothetical protein
LITLTFRPALNQSPVLVRGAYFRICADGTLRGPDNAIAANYADGLWQLGPKPYLGFECAGPVYLRVTNRDGRSERIGPYEFIKASEGAIYTHDSCLGIFAAQGDLASSAELWREIALLPAQDGVREPAGHR